MRGVVKQAINDNLKDKQFTLAEASNGQEALDILAKDKIDLVLLDWNMPILDGMSFVKKVRGSGITVPIIMITSVTDEEKIMEAGMAGVNSYIEKPIRGTHLWDQIKEFIK